MKKETLPLIKEASFYLLSTIVCFALILVLLKYTTDTPVTPLEVISSMFGIAYILTIRNPNNYIGFYVGIVSSVLLAWHFFNINEIPSGVIYMCVYIPCQILTIISWVKNKKSAKQGEVFAPSFLSRKMLYYSLAVLLAIIIVSYIVYSQLYEIFWVMVLMNAVFVGTNILANVLVIMKKCECFFFWILSCILGAVIFTLAGSYFTVLLYFVFITINALALINWSICTPEKNYGWTAKQK